MLVGFFGFKKKYNKGGGGVAAFFFYFWLDPKVTKDQGLNRLGYSGRILRCHRLNSLRSDKGGSEPLRIHPPLHAHPLRPFVES